MASSDPELQLFCGPVAVAALTGAAIDEVICIIQQYRDDFRDVRGTNLYELQHAFRHFGFDIKLAENYYRDPPTLARWERNRSRWKFEQAWLVTVTGHWVAVRGQWFVDTFSDGKPARIADAPRKRARVRLSYRVFPASVAVSDDFRR